jgi:hypothetical protein
VKDRGCHPLRGGEDRPPSRPPPAPAAGREHAPNLPPACRSSPTCARSGYELFGLLWAVAIQAWELPSLFCGCPCFGVLV